MYCFDRNKLFFFFTKVDDGAITLRLFVCEDKMQAFSEIQGLRGKSIPQKGKKKPFPMWTMVFPF